MAVLEAGFGLGCKWSSNMVVLGPADPVTAALFVLTQLVGHHLIRNHTPRAPVMLVCLPALPTSSRTTSEALRRAQG